MAKEIELGEAMLDVQAWYQARVRRDAAQEVEAERLRGAIDALREKGFSIRQIAATLEVPQTRIMRAMASSGSPRSGYTPLAGGVGEGILPDAFADEEYQAAHASAWRHYPPAAKSIDFGISGCPAATWVARQG